MRTGLQSLLEPGPAVFLARHLLRLDLAQPNPGGDGSRVALVGTGAPVGDLRLGIDPFPTLRGDHAEKAQGGQQNLLFVLPRQPELGQGAVLHELLDRQPLQPGQPALGVLLLVQASQVFPIGGLAPQPEIGRRAADLLQFERGLLGDGGLALDDLVDGLDRPAHAQGQFLLGESPFFQQIQEGFSRRADNVWLIGPTRINHGNPPFRMRIDSILIQSSPSRRHQLKMKKTAPDLRP